MSGEEEPEMTAGNQIPYLWTYLSTRAELVDGVIRRLFKAGYKDVQSDEGWVLFNGTLPVVLMAHIDTVHKRPPLAGEIVLKNGSFSAPGVGIGGDDRAGVAAILELVSRGFRPHVMLFDGEEQGGIGVKAAMKFLDKPPEGSLFLVEFDRREANDAVFYDCDSPEFTKYIESFGFKKAWGSYTDVKSLSPHWKLAGVNLSIGYYDAHTPKERVNIKDWWQTIERSTTMLRSLPDKAFEFKRTVYQSYGGNSGFKGVPKIEVPHYTPYDLVQALGGEHKKWEKLIESLGEMVAAEVEDILLQQMRDLYAMLNSPEGVQLPSDKLKKVPIPKSERLAFAVQNQQDFHRSWD